MENDVEIHFLTEQHFEIYIEVGTTFYNQHYQYLWKNGFEMHSETELPFSKSIKTERSMYIMIKRLG